MKKVQLNLLSDEPVELSYRTDVMPRSNYDMYRRGPGGLVHVKPVQVDQDLENLWSPAELRRSSSVRELLEAAIWIYLNPRMQSVAPALFRFISTQLVLLENID